MLVHMGYVIAMDMLDHLQIDLTSHCMLVVQTTEHNSSWLKVTLRL